MCLGFILPPLYGKDKSGLRQIIITTRVYFSHIPISYCWLTEGMDTQMVSLMSLPEIMALFIIILGTKICSMQCLFWQMAATYLLLS